jgi:phosphate transport system substrate-binding protein
VKITRMSSLLALVAVGALTLSACGSDDNTTTTSSAAAEATSAASSAGAGADSEASSAAPASGDTTFEGAGFACAEGDLRSSGSTAQGKVMEQWIADFNALCNANLNAYGGGGSGKGIADFLANQVDFAGSDSALKEDQAATAESTRCAGNPALNLPMVTGPIALAYNISGVDSLVLTPEVLSGIFNGTISSWDDPAIAALNSGVTLPGLAIQAVHRAEDSGTTENFTKYLSAAPGGVAAQGSDGVSKQIASTDGSIGYVEWGFAIDDGLNVAEIDNGAGAVELTAESAGLAVAAAEIVGTGDDLALSIDYATQEAGVYPVVLVTYEIVCSGGNGDLGALLKSFLGYTATDGQASLEDLGAAPLPAEIQEKVIASVSTIS